jgi:replicative DNA helicase
MVKKELIKRSPLRILEKTIHGGLGKGNLGLIAARKGVGKTAFLVHLATDQLFQDKHVIHVSFSSNTKHIVEWYEDIFNEISKRFELESVMSVHDTIIKNRVIMNFSQEGISTAQVTSSLKSMISDGHFNADVIIVDGYDFTKSTPEEVYAFKQFAEEMSLEIWFSASLKEEDLEFNNSGVPVTLGPFIDILSILIFLRHKEGIISLELKKDHDEKNLNDLTIKLDPKILLITS